MKTANFAIIPLAVLAFASFASADTFTGPTSAYYLDDPSNSMIYVVQGTSVIDSFAMAYGGGSQEAMLAVTNSGGVSTNPSYAYTSGGTGGQYTLGGVATSVPYAAPGLPISPDYNSDGTSDGTYNYYIENYGFSGTEVIRTGLDWQDPTVLFATSGGGNLWGVAFDADNNSLWVSGWVSNTIQDYSLAPGNLGTELSSFVPGINTLSALGYDPRDGTLWASVGQGTELVQFNTSGILLQAGTPSGLAGGGSFASGDFAQGPVPEPATLLLMGSGLLAVARRLRKK